MQEKKQEDTDYKKTLLVDLHLKYIENLDKKKDTFEYWITEHLRISGIYWAMGALDILNRLDIFDRSQIINQVVACQREDGGFGGNDNHDSHMLYDLVSKFTNKSHFSHKLIL